MTPQANQAVVRRLFEEVYNIFRLANNRIVEHWGVWDTHGMMQQLGVNAGIH